MKKRGDSAYPKHRPEGRREAPPVPKGGAKRRPSREALRAGEFAKPEPVEVRSDRARCDKSRR